MNERVSRLLLHGGSLVLPGRVQKGSLLVEEGRIAAILEGDGEAVPDCRRVDVSGQMVLPGLIDTHVHMWDPSPMDYREDWWHGSRCAASGGITTIVEMPLSVPPVSDRAGFEHKRQVAERDSVVDFALWGALIPSSIGDMEELDQLGCVGYKGFLSFANPDYPQITDGYLVEGMKRAQRFDGLIALHAENAEVCDFGSRRMAEESCPDEAMHDDARPWWAELEAIQRAVLFSKVTGARTLICHMTIAEGAEFLKHARCEGAPVFVETCPHYLLFDREALRQHKAFAKCNPPFRSRENVDRLWSYLLDGTIDVIGSDHGPYTDGEKEQGNFWEAYSGFGGYDAMLPALVTEGIHKRGMSWPRLAELTSSRAAELLGLAPRKGSLLPGSDADIVVLAPHREWRYDGARSLSKTKSVRGPYQGMGMRGQVTATYVRGQLVWDGREIAGEAGWGTLIPRIGKV